MSASSSSLRPCYGLDREPLLEAFIAFLATDAAVLTAPQGHVCTMGRPSLTPTEPVQICVVTARARSIELDHTPRATVVAVTRDGDGVGIAVEGVATRTGQKISSWAMAIELSRSAQRVDRNN